MAITITSATNDINFTVGRAGADGADGQGIAAGGTTGQTLVKASGADYDTEWSNAGVGDLVAANNLSDLANAATARTNLGLGTAATTAASAYATAAQGTLADSAVQPGDNISGLTNDSGFIAGITGEPLSDLSDVTITTIASGELLKWNGAAWVNNTIAEAGLATAAQGTLADSATQPGDNISDLTNDSGFTTNTGTVDTSGTPVLNDFARFTDADTIEGRSYAETKADLSLDNVENTALSTWTGSTNLDTLGAGAVDAITEIDASLKSGSDTTLITGTAGTSGNLAQFNADGDVVDASVVAADVKTTRTGVYRELYIDAAAMTPSTTNGATAGSNEFATNDLDWDYFAFATDADDYVQFKLVMPDVWDRSTIKAKFFWTTATGTSVSDSITWGIQAVAISNDDAIDAAWGTAQVIADAVLAANGTDLQVSSATPALTVGGTPALGDMIAFRVYRDVSADTVPEDIWLLGVQIQYQESSTEPSAW